MKIGKKYVWKHTIIDQNAITRSQIKEKKKKLNAKREELKKIALKFFSLKSLINRNRTASNEDIIRFPFVVVATEENPENSIKLDSNINITEIGLKFLKEIKLFGDYEILQKLKLKQDLSLVPEEVTNLLSIH